MSVRNIATVIVAAIALAGLPAGAAAQAGLPAGASGQAGRPAGASAQAASLDGRWTLNRQLSQFPTDVGFGMDLVSALGPDAGTGGSDGGGRHGGGGGSGLSATFRESQFDATRREQLVDEVRNPSPHLTIRQTETTVTVTDERGRPRTFHPNGREESQPLDQVSVATTARWENAGLVVLYKVEQNRELRYTYTRTVDPPQLVVKVEFLEHGGHATLTRVYQPTSANEVVAPAPAPAAAAAPAPAAAAAAAAPAGAQPAGTAAAGTPSTGNAPTGAPPATGTPPGAPVPSYFLKQPQGVPPAGQEQKAPIVGGGPDAELKGLTNIGVVVEDLGSQAASCGLKQAPIEAAVVKSLSDAGFKVMRNADEDTYVYVHITTGTMGPGLCVSRYDVFLYTNTTATLSYQATPQLVQVSLLHKGGLAGGAPAANGGAVASGVKQYVDEFAKRIRAANGR